MTESVTAKPNPVVHVLELAVKQTGDRRIWPESLTILRKGETLSNEALQSLDLHAVRLAIDRAEAEFRRSAERDLSQFEERLTIQHRRDVHRLSELTQGHGELLSQMAEADDAALKAGILLNLAHGSSRKFRTFRWAVAAIQRRTLSMTRRNIRQSKRLLLKYRMRSAARFIARNLWRILIGLGGLTVVLGAIQQAAAFVVGNLLAIFGFWFLQEYWLGPILNRWLEQKERHDLASAARDVHMLGVLMLASRRLLDCQLPKRVETKGDGPYASDDASNTNSPHIA